MSLNKVNNTEEKELVWVGTIVNTHALKGEVRILSTHVERDEIFSVNQNVFYLNKFNNFEKIIIESYRLHKNFILIKFKEFNSINEVEFLKGQKLYKTKEETTDDEFYYSDLIGFKVFENNNLIGVIKSYFDQKQYFSFEVELINGKTTNIPIIDEIITKIDHESKHIEIIFLNNEY